MKSEEDPEEFHSVQDYVPEVPQDNVVEEVRVSSPTEEIPDGYKRKRYTLVYLICLGFIISFGMRCNIGAAMTEMENKPLGLEDLNKYRIGCIFTQIPGAIAATKYRANIIFGSAIAISAGIHLFVPVTAQLGKDVIGFLQLAQGLFEGVTFPACLAMLGLWAPPKERATMMTIAFSGTFLGTVLGVPISYLLVDLMVWSTPFYVYGFCGILWYCCWLYFVSEKPATHPEISVEERKYIEESVGPASQMPIGTIPWKAMLLSKPVWAVFAATFSRSWTFYAIVVSQPQFWRHFFQSDGPLAAFAANLLMVFIVRTAGIQADSLPRRRAELQKVKVRKVFTSAGLAVEALCLLLIFWDHVSISSLFVIIALVVSAISFTGCMVNHLDIAPRFSGLLMAIPNCLGMISCSYFIGLTSPMSLPNRDDWTFIFRIAAGLLVCGAGLFAKYASADEESWAIPSDSSVEPTAPPLELLEDAEPKRAEQESNGLVEAIPSTQQKEIP